MSYPEALILALVQALTEFLPVSSSGHLILLQRWFEGAGEIDLLYDVLLHVATMLAVVVYFRRDLLTLLRGLARPGRSSDGTFGAQERRAVIYLALANLPTAVVGWLIQHYLIGTLTRPDIVGFMLMMTGVILLLGRRALPGRPMAAMRPLDALTIGLAQGLAVIPGISRSGTTITAGIALGLDRELAARFSLLMAIPAILGATVLQWHEAPAIAPAAFGPYAAGMIVAAAVGYLAIEMILRLIRKRRFHLFAYYVWPLGLGAILVYHLAG